MYNLVPEYARLISPAHIHLPSPSPGAFFHLHNVLLSKILLDPHLRAYPPSPEYKLKFWKWAVQELESLIGDQVSVQYPYGVAHRV